MNLVKYSNFLAEKKGLKKRIETQKSDIEIDLEREEQNVSNLRDARDLMNTVGVIAQNEVKIIIEELVTQALQSVFGKRYSFVIENVVQRNKPETNFYIDIDGKKFSLREELGGGVIDVVSFSVRIVLWALMSPRSSSTIILDEPGKFISKDKLQGFGEMIKQLSDTLGIQFIVVSHEYELANVANVAYNVNQENGVSNVERV